MLSTIILKELKSIISSPKFVITFAACSIMILLSVWVGIEDYRTGVARTDAALDINYQILKTRTWSAISTQAFRYPDPMQIFVSGVHNDVGRLSDIREYDEVKLRNSVFSDDTIFAVFRLVDFAFIVQIVLSLLAILFTYDAINGEREEGTLQLTFSNPVPRAKFILGKLIGSWLGLVIPLLIPILLSILLILLMQIPMTPLHWQNLGGLLLVSLLYFTFFIALGLLTSALARRSATSFLIALVVWVFFVFIIPRAGVMAAGQFVDVPGVAEIDSRKAAFSKEQSDRLNEEMMKRSMERWKRLAAMSPEEREVNSKKLSEEYSREMDKLREERDVERAEYSSRLNEDRRNRQAYQERLGFILSRFSPASAFRLAAMNLASTDILLKSRAEDAMKDFRSKLLVLAEEKTRQEDQGGLAGRGIRIMSRKKDDGKVSLQIDMGDPPTMDPADVPVFRESPRDFNETASGTLVDIGLLAVYSIVAFSITFAAFLRYDVR
ncbi:MAG: ABC transporter permease subunit [Acidobacteria bacterium]|nr:ABC transporter permease subunit [Acidobacteriota bacterium]